MSSLSSSLFPSPALSLRLPHPLIPSHRRLLAALSLASSPRSPLSFIAPPHQQRSRAASRTHETRVSAKSLCHLANARPRRGNYPAPCAIAKNQLLAPPTRHRRPRRPHPCRRRRRRPPRQRRIAERDPLSRINGKRFYSFRSLAERKRRRQRARKCALVSRFEGSF